MHFLQRCARAHAERELARAKYLSTQDLVVLQALVIYTSMLPYANMHDVAGPLAASTVQIAMQNGLHLKKERDGLQDADVREMMWLQVCFMSSRSKVADAAASEWSTDIADVTACCDRQYPNSTEQTLLLFTRQTLLLFTRQTLLLFTRQTIWDLSRQMRHLGGSVETGDVEALVNAALLGLCFL